MTSAPRTANLETTPPGASPADGAPSTGGRRQSAAHGRLRPLAALRFVLLPKSIANASKSGAYFLHGNDEFRKEQAARHLVDRFSDPASRDFDLDRLDGSEVSAERLATVVATPPMLAERRVVVVTGAEALATRPKERAVVLDAAKRSPPRLVLIVQATKPARSKARFYRDLAAAATTAEFKAVSQNEAPAWLVTWARAELETEIELEAARALVRSLGSNLGILTTEARKLAALAGDGAAVDMETVRQGGFEIAQQDRWAWFDLVGQRRFPEAIRGARALARHGETPVGLVNGLATHLLRVGAAVEGGPGALSAVLPPYQQFLQRRLAGQAKQWNSASLAAAVQGLGRLDQLLKASSLPGEGLLEDWLRASAAWTPSRAAGRPAASSRARRR